MLIQILQQPAALQSFSVRLSINYCYKLIDNNNDDNDYNYEGDDGDINDDDSNKIRNVSNVEI